MKPLVIAKTLAAVGAAIGALGGASVAHARGEVYLHVQPPAARYVQPAPVYVQPAPAYVQPYRQYRNEPSGYGHQRRGPWGDHDGDGIANAHDRDSPFHQRRMARLYGPYGDLDGDGIMNQDDRDRDGDGVRNRHDRFPDDRYRY